MAVQKHYGWGLAFLVKGKWWQWILPSMCSYARAEDLRIVPSSPGSIIKKEWANTHATNNMWATKRAYDWDVRDLMNQDVVETATANTTNTANTADTTEDVEWSHIIIIYIVWITLSLCNVKWASIFHLMHIPQINRWVIRFIHCMVIIDLL